MRAAGSASALLGDVGWLAAFSILREEVLVTDTRI